MELPCICEKEDEDLWFDDVFVYIKLASSLKVSAYYISLIKDISIFF